MLLMNRTETLPGQPGAPGPARLVRGPHAGAAWAAPTREHSCGGDHMWVGHGTRVVLDYLGAQHVDAVDLGPPDGRQGRATPTPLLGHGFGWPWGDATGLQGVFGAEGDSAYDAAVDFAIVHHIQDWRAALAEIARVLRPGGTFYFDEGTARIPWRCSGAGRGSSARWRRLR